MISNQLFTYQLDESEGSVRIHNWYAYNVSHSDPANYMAKGAIEVYHYGVWGGICATNNSPRIAIIACKQLGYTVGYKRTYCCDDATPTKKIWINSITCSANDTRLSNCRYSYGYRTNGCSNRYSVECHRKCWYILLCCKVFLHFS